MAYVAGDTILDDEYNKFVNNSSTPFGINFIGGTGTGNVGLGQTEIATVGAGDTVTAAQWNSLFTFMDNVANHTNDSLSSTAARTAGDPIAVVSALAADLLSLENEVKGGSTSATAVSEGSEDASIVASAVFDTSHIVEQRFDFQGGDEARFFFNAGGTIRVKITNGKTNDTDKDAVVDALITSLGNFDLRATTNTRTGSGNTLGGTQTLGYYDLTTSYQTLMTVTEDAGTYSGNILIKIEGKTNSAHGDSRGNNGDQVTLKVSVLLNDSTRTDYTTGNLSSVNVEEEAAGPTDIAFHTVDPTTAQGLSTVYTNISTTAVSNAIVNND
tara:strand:+ start:916 stop:1899 length:984 start_codon:yes stop_codon:yes gene_type:complete